MPTIFISHSCKDNEQAPPSTLSPQDAAARTGRLAFSRKLRAAMVTALEKDPRYKVFLDVRGGLKPGDIWQDGLHRALRTCSAGLVLLTPESLEMLASAATRSQMVLTWIPLGDSAWHDTPLSKYQALVTSEPTTAACCFAASNGDCSPGGVVVVSRSSRWSGNSAWRTKDRAWSTDGLIRTPPRMCGRSHWNNVDSA